jgi:ribosomal protein L7Ae-like RNA K-turn-binding protein
LKKILNNIGLAYKAKKIVLGTDNIVEKMKNKKVKLVIVSASSSYNTQKLIQDKAVTYGADVLLLVLDDEDISQAIGKNNVKILGISDVGFKKMILRSIEGRN